MGKRSKGQKIKHTLKFTKIAAKAANPKQEAMDHWLWVLPAYFTWSKGCQPVSRVDYLPVDV